MRKQPCFGLFQDLGFKVVRLGDLKIPTPCAGPLRHLDDPDVVRAFRRFGVSQNYWFLVRRI